MFAIRRVAHRYSHSLALLSRFEGHGRLPQQGSCFVAPGRDVVAQLKKTLLDNAGEVLTTFADAANCLRPTFPYLGWPYGSEPHEAALFPAHQGGS